MKQKLIYVFISLFFITSCSVDRLQNPIIIEGIDGSSTLVTVTNLPIGSQSCPSGGTQLSFGTDIDNDGVIDEVQSSATVCNGIDGKDGKDGTSVLVEVNAIQPSNEYPNGAVSVATGYDINGDGVLDEIEISDIEIVVNGTNGNTALIKTTIIDENEEINGVVYKEGGFIFESGIDTDGNGVLEPTEITSTNYIRNGENGFSIAYRVEQLGPSDEYPNGGIEVFYGLDVDGDKDLGIDEQIDSYIVQNGTNGLTTLSDTNPYFVDNELAGEMLFFGVDTNSNGVLDESERTSETIILNGLPGNPGPAGENGLNSLISSIETENGFEVSSGLDDNRNGVLEITEIDDVYIVTNGTNGTDGTSPTVELEQVQGGVNISTYTIINGETIKFGDTVFVSNGRDGDDGTNGTNGVDGNDCVDCCTFTTITPVPPGNDCVAGGKKISIYKDTNGDKVLDGNDELISFAFICNPPECYEVVAVPNNITFDNNGLERGDIVSSIFTIGNTGGEVLINGSRVNFTGNQAMIYDADNPSGNDVNDLGTVDSGNLLIISGDNDSSDPDDNHHGGILTFDFTRINSIVKLESIDLIDIEYESDSVGRNRIIITEKGSNVVTEIDIAFNGTGLVTTYPLSQFTDVATMTIILVESGAVDNLKFNYSTVRDVCNPFGNVPQ